MIYANWRMRIISLDFYPNEIFKYSVPHEVFNVFAGQENDFILITFIVIFVCFPLNQGGRQIKWPFHRDYSRKVLKNMHHFGIVLKSWSNSLRLLLFREWRKKEDHWEEMSDKLLITAHNGTDFHKIKIQ